MSRPGYLRNRRIFITRQPQHVWSQRYKYGWDNKWGTTSHEGYTYTFMGAMLLAIIRKVGADVGWWLTSRPVKTWWLG